MFGRNQKALGAILMSALLLFSETARAAYLCTETLVRFDTIEDCEDRCTGLCVGDADDQEESYHVCGFDRDGDGIVRPEETRDCLGTWLCPLDRSVPCAENETCTRQGSCTLIESPHERHLCTADDREYETSEACRESCSESLTVYVCPTNGGEYATEATCESACPGSTSCEARTKARPLPCKTETYTVTEHECSIDSVRYEARDACLAACTESAECEFGYVCPDPTRECVNITSPASYEEAPPNLSYYQDDGATDPETGECLGELFLFGGSPMMCRPSGWETHFRDCCDANDETVEALGGQLAMLKNTFAVVAKIRDAIETAYEAVKLYNQVSETYQLSIVTEEIVSAEAAMMEIGSAAEGAVASMVTEAGTLAGTATDAAVNALTSVLSVSLSGIVISVIMYFVMEWIASGCDPDDMTTAAYDELGLCHSLGTKCVKELEFLGCVQRAKVFCCFNSKLARIIHEQGRGQLQNFNPGGAWGSAGSPNCRGFSPEEFQMLDFSRIDLSEWYEDIETRTQDEIRENMERNIETFRDTIR